MNPEHFFENKEFFRFSFEKLIFYVHFYCNGLLLGLITEIN